MARHKEVLTIQGETRHAFGRSNTSMEVDRGRTCLLAFDEAAAERDRAPDFPRRKDPLGLDADISGMVCRSADAINAINVPVETVAEGLLF